MVSSIHFLIKIYNILIFFFLTFFLSFLITATGFDLVVSYLHYLIIPHNILLFYKFRVMKGQLDHPGQEEKLGLRDVMAFQDFQGKWAGPEKRVSNLFNVARLQLKSFTREFIQRSNLKDKDMFWVVYYFGALNTSLRNLVPKIATTKGLSGTY